MSEGNKSPDPTCDVVLPSRVEQVTEKDRGAESLIRTQSVQYEAGERI